MMLVYIIEENNVSQINGSDMYRSASMPDALYLFDPLLLTRNAVPTHPSPQVRQQVQRQLAKALMGLTLEFRKEETRFLNKVGVIILTCDPYL